MKCWGGYIKRKDDFEVGKPDAVMYVFTPQMIFLLCSFGLNHPSTSSGEPKVQGKHQRSAGFAGPAHRKTLIIYKSFFYPEWKDEDSAA